MRPLTRPRPLQGLYEKPFWDAVQMRELRLQRCRKCSHVWYPPAPVCPQCLSDTWSFELMSGRGRIIAWTVFHRQYFPDIPTPYLVVSVALEEGPLMIGNVISLAPEDVRLDLPVSVDFESVQGKDGDWLIVQWTPA